MVSRILKIWVRSGKWKKEETIEEVDYIWYLVYLWTCLKSNGAWMTEWNTLGCKLKYLNISEINTTGCHTFSIPCMLKSLLVSAESLKCEQIKLSFSLLLLPYAPVWFSWRMTNGAHRSWFIVSSQGHQHTEQQRYWFLNNNKPSNHVCGLLWTTHVGFTSSVTSLSTISPRAAEQSASASQLTILMILTSSLCRAQLRSICCGPQAWLTKVLLCMKSPRTTMPPCN